MSVVIQWKKGSKFSGKPDAAYKALESLRGKHGHLTADLVKDSAKKPSSALHRHIYDCPVGVAADRYYTNRARTLIRSIEVVTAEAPKAPVRAFSVVTQPTKGDEPPRKVYQSTEEAMQDPVMRDEILANAIREAIAFRRKYHALQELGKVFSAMDEFLETAKV